mmetsp:Transcript_33672/g.85147  ORF Transcript_33672/g.85147 Transcript_33672/m.85147 type:complete len:90 (+) Transcript_33672:38-307(+)
MPLPPPPTHVITTNHPNPEQHGSTQSPMLALYSLIYCSLSLSLSHSLSLSGRTSQQHLLSHRNKQMAQDAAPQNTNNVREKPSKEPDSQ